MKQNQIRQVRVHLLPAPDGKTVVQRANQFYQQIVIRRLEEARLTPALKAQVLAELIEGRKTGGL